MCACKNGDPSKFVGIKGKREGNFFFEKSPPPSPTPIRKEKRTIRTFFEKKSDRNHKSGDTTNKGGHKAKRRERESVMLPFRSQRPKKKPYSFVFLFLNAP